MTSTTRRLTTAGLLAGVAASAIVGSATTSTAAPKEPSANGQGSVAAVRAHTAKYLDVDVALAQGYVPVGGCEATPSGAMGIHYLNFGLAGDGTVDMRYPEALLYVATENGLELAGVEYFVAEAAAPERPTALGQPFDGPMAGHGPGMPAHYDLHSWIWKANPAGTFAPWNPALSCGGGQ